MTSTPKRHMQLVVRITEFGLTLVGISAQAQSFPSQQIKLIVPFAAGSSTDVLDRAVGKNMGGIWAGPWWSRTSRTRRTASAQNQGLGPHRMATPPCGERMQPMPRHMPSRLGRPTILRRTSRRLRS